MERPIFFQDNQPKICPSHKAQKTTWGFYQSEPCKRQKLWQFQRLTCWAWHMEKETPTMGRSHWHCWLKSLCLDGSHFLVIDQTDVAMRCWNMKFWNVLFCSVCKHLAQIMLFSLQTNLFDTHILCGSFANPTTTTTDMQLLWWLIEGGVKDNQRAS